MIEIVLVFLFVLLAARPLGNYAAQAMGGGRVFLTPVFAPLEKVIYRVAGTDPKVEMSWMQYAFGLLMLNGLGFLLLFTIVSSQQFLPMNPQQLSGLPPDLAFNLAISFITNTNWQSYGGESTLSYFSQMAGLTVQHFLSAATGIAAALALFRAFGRSQSPTVGNCWADVTRAIMYILLPLSLVVAMFFVAEGVVQSFNAYPEAVTLEGMKQSIALGPAASQIAIKMLGSNGGGFFNANSAHPFENPTAFTDLVQLIAIILLPVVMLYAFGATVRDRRQGWSLILCALLLLVPCVAFAVYMEYLPNPMLAGLGIDQAAGNMEGKEVRFGPALSAFWAALTTTTSNGSANAAHDSFMPLGGLVPMLLMQFGEVVFGGVGSGAYGLLLFVVVAVFMGGLMVGRTPEFMGKKIGPFEMKMASLAVITPCALTLVGTAIAVMTEAGRAGVMNPGPQSFSEILYALTSAANNNGSAFGGLTASTPFYNILLGVVMLLGRFMVMIAALAVAGSCAVKTTVPPSAGTLPTYTMMFILMLATVIVIVGVLTHVPALALGPVAEHLQLFSVK